MPKKGKRSSKRASKRGSKRGSKRSVSRKRSESRRKNLSAAGLRKKEQQSASSSGVSDESAPGPSAPQPSPVAGPSGRGRGTPRRSRTPSPEGGGLVAQGFDESSFVGEVSPGFNPRAQGSPSPFAPRGGQMDMSDPQSPISQPSVPPSPGQGGYNPMGRSPTPPVQRTPPSPEGGSPEDSGVVSQRPSDPPLEESTAAGSQFSVPSAGKSRSPGARSLRSRSRSPARGRGSRASGRRARSYSPNARPDDATPLHNRSPRGKSRGRGAPRRLDFDAGPSP